MTSMRNSYNTSFSKIVNFLKRKFTIDLLILFIISLALFTIAMISKEMIGDWIYRYVGQNYNYGYINDEGVRITWYFETYLDAEIYYELFTNSFIYDDWNPYVISDGYLNNYLYGPLFLYGEVIFHFILALFHPDATITTITKTAIKWNAIFFDSLCVIMVYLIIVNFKVFREKKISKHIIGIISALALTFAPINLYYIDAYYLNIPQMTFFTLLTFYLFTNKRYILASIFLSFGWMTKQLPLFFLFPLFFILSKKYNVSFALKKFIVPHIITCFVISIPWIFITPLLYLGRIIGAGRPLWYVSLEREARGHGTTLAHSFAYMGCDICSQILFYLNISMVQFLFVFIVGNFISHFNGDKILDDEFNFYLFFNWFNIILHTFLSRGVFKYYDAFFNPFLIIMCVIIITKLMIYINTKNITEKHASDNVNPVYIEKIIFKNNLVKFTLTVICILIALTLFYSINWLLMIIIRFMHPIILLGLCLIVSFTVPFSFYQSLDYKSNYKNFGWTIGQVFVLSYRKVRFAYLKILRRRKQSITPHDKL